MIQRRPVTRVTGRSSERTDDDVAVERALEIRVDGRALSVTLRTPGHDDELALGFLASEGVVRSAADVRGCTAAGASHRDEPDTIDVLLADGVALDWSKLERNFAATAACGICGRAHLESLHAGLARATAPAASAWDIDALLALSRRAREGQEGFAATGGLHAAVWCDAALEPRVLREDVGRHNAVDKVCGWLLREGLHAKGEGLLWVSGRAGAELVLKAARARVPVLAAVGAPTTLAIELAETAGITLVGFLREDRLNVYTGGFEA
ncbi:MAG: formate dehydrogenase accessory sulfurtransferase FdhD [Candidatus Eisenbacteria bacterium]|uniref:Sulfur carrier protein FdhD n=1 Tax=Eiseniibacteriota bacterium TaxID=2212470 RepID=A0A933W0F9_UNCEI|nr:formate dehydrogenase accessory sulfurtransferase FdhD [Candidatus Eisenbacteria bacterium]